jgi:hypothetical protein
MHMAKKRRLVTRRKTADALGILGDMAGTIPVHRNDLKGPIYATVLDPRGGTSSEPRRGTSRQMVHKPIIIIVVGKGGRCVKHEFAEVIYYVCGGSLS